MRYHLEVWTSLKENRERKYLNIVMNNEKNMTQQTATQLRFKAQVFHALSASDRLEIVEFLRNGEKCVCEIVPHLNLIQPMVSRHLKILKDAGIIRCRKDGTKRMYSVVDPRVYGAVDAITPEIIAVFQKEVMEQLSCSPTEDR
jgi:DNA-binding transcriptional ArsR family regulator